MHQCKLQNIHQWQTEHRQHNSKLETEETRPDQHPVTTQHFTSWQDTHKISIWLHQSRSDFQGETRNQYLEWWGWMINRYFLRWDGTVREIICMKDTDKVVISLWNKNWQQSAPVSPPVSCCQREKSSLIRIQSPCSHQSSLHKIFKSRRNLSVASSSNRDEREYHLNTSFTIARSSDWPQHNQSDRSESALPSSSIQHYHHHFLFIRPTPHIRATSRWRSSVWSGVSTIITLEQPSLIWERNKISLMWHLLVKTVRWRLTRWCSAHVHHSSGTFSRGILINILSFTFEEFNIKTSPQY